MGSFITCVFIMPYFECSVGYSNLRGNIKNDKILRGKYYF